MVYNIDGPMFAETAVLERPMTDPGDYEEQVSVAEPVYIADSSDIPF
jgi:hypothetical protein